MLSQFFYIISYQLDINIVLGGSCDANNICATPAICNTKGICQNAFQLQNYWPMNNFSDLVGGANFVDGLSYSFTSDRFGIPNQAVNFINGYLKLPSGIYLSGDFTFTAWFTITQYSNTSVMVLFDFTNDGSSDAVYLVFTMPSPNGPKPTLQFNVFNERYSSIQSINTQNLQLNSWYQLAFTSSLKTGSIYLNGQLIHSRSGLYSPNSVIRTKNAIGAALGEYWAQYFTGNMDDVKIYKGALSEKDVMNVYNTESQKIITNIALGERCDANNLCASTSICNSGKCQSRIFLI